MARLVESAAVVVCLLSVSVARSAGTAREETAGAGHPKRDVIVFDLTADWSDANNPSGPWSYNWGGAPISVHVDNWAYHELGPGQPAWAYAETGYNPDHVPAWMQAVALHAGWDVAVGDVVVHSSNTYGPELLANVSWTAPTTYAGPVTLSGAVWLMKEVAGRGLDWRLRLNSDLLDSGTLFIGDQWNRAQPRTFSFDVPIAAGGVVMLEFEKTGTWGVTAGVQLTITGTPCNPAEDEDCDGVPDALDNCPGTPPGVPVDADGCPVDDLDGDGVPNESDVCQGTPPGTVVDPEGRPLGDIDLDCDTDMDDFALFQTGMTGPLDCGTVYYLDYDADGYGDPTRATTACSQPPGCVDNDLDCNDNDPNTYPGALDVPDGSFADQNCDGIDGDISRAVFVSVAGDDDDPGTPAQPMRTIEAANALAANSADIDHVYVDAGLYTEQIVVRDGVSIWGGYSAANGWERSDCYTTRVLSATVENGRIVGLVATGITSPTTIGQLTITTADAPSGAAFSNYAVYVSASSEALVLSGNLIEAGNGGSGAAGVVGWDGAAGADGADGSPGACDGAAAAGGGSGGTSPTDPGGRGGDGGDVFGSPDGAPGESGSSGSGGFGGSGGVACSPGSLVGVDGQAGAGGQAGQAGDGAVDADGSVSGGYWYGASGGVGFDGQAGRGGGGGGGGAGQDCTCWAPPCVDGTGNGGGGGGAGGGGGTGGDGGGAGGASFGVFLVDADGVQLIGNTILAGNGGDGVAGGLGGSGGAGGMGGSGANACTDEVGAGGDGGAGGAGGRGGQGGGGAGGVSFAVGRFNSTVTLDGNTLLHGWGGVGGVGGGHGGNGVTGASGMVKDW